MDFMLRHVYYSCWEQEFEESEVVDDSGYIYVIREQLGRKRSFDQIATYGELKSSESPVKMSLSSMNGPAQPSPEKLPVVIASHDGVECVTCFVEFMNHKGCRVKKEKKHVLGVFE